MSTSLLLKKHERPCYNSDQDEQDMQCVVYAVCVCKVIHGRRTNKSTKTKRDRGGGGGEVRSARWPVGLQPSGATHAAVLGLWYWILAPTFVAKF